ncbi:type VI secretion system Vgr family protein [Tabrizicola sp.]|uniref:type VI secretion system Vgr family protein n=1 Tax=Tabrizicola sp. TaxID=2005166 RepID=UPI003F2AABBF
MNAPSDFIQAERILKVDSPLGADVLLAQKLTWREGISELFEGRVAVRSKNQDLRAGDLLGKAVDVSVELGAGERRTWNAIVTDLIAGPRQTRGLRHYELVLRPDVWLLSQTSDCRIWMDKSALDVAVELLGEHGIAAPVTDGVVGEVPKQHYSVQWNETDLDFLTRRLEEDGLFYWWTHEAGSHQMHIASHATGYTGGEDVRFAHGSTDRNHITRFETTFRYLPGKYAGADWNFTTPGQVPGGASPSLVSLPKNGNYERYEYPILAGYGSGGRASEGIEDGAVERAVKLRMQAQEAEHARVEGGSTVRTLAVGAKFTPYDVANPDNTFDPHVILAIEHTSVDTSYESVANQPEYENRFLAIPAGVPATPGHRTTRPRIDGAQVAIVAGPEGEEIHPDEYGRIKLWFPWDRRAKKDGSDTCWVRVMQSWAGGSFGAQVIPRIGMEVMVSYLDGDPDRPVVTGVVPNTTQKVPYDLPADKTRMVIRSKSYKSEGRNELTFEDATGNENLFMHASKDQTTKVLNNRAKRVEANEVASIGQNRSVEVGQNQKTEIGNSMNLTVGGTGLQALGLMSQLASLAPQTAGLLTQAGAVAGAGGPQAVALGGMAMSLASSALGFFSGGGLSGREGVVSSGDTTANAGDALRKNAAQVGEDAGGILSGLPGMMNTVIGSFNTRSVGIADVQQVGVSKVTNVGQTNYLNVGKVHKITVGEEFVIEVGAKDDKPGRSFLIMKSDGTIIIKGKKFHFEAEGPFNQIGKVIDLN